MNIKIEVLAWIETERRPVLKQVCLSEEEKDCVLQTILLKHNKGNEDTNAPKLRLMNFEIPGVCLRSLTKNAIYSIIEREVPSEENVDQAFPEPTIEE